MWLSKELTFGIAGEVNHTNDIFYFPSLQSVLLKWWKQNQECWIIYNSNAVWKQRWKLTFLLLKINFKLNQINKCALTTMNQIGGEK